MKPPRLSLCLIVKNEAHNLPRLIASAVDAFDEINITDTGSTDETKKVAEELCGKKLKWSEFEWCNDFSKARNFNYEQATGDWLVWADADDEIKNADRLPIIAAECDTNQLNAVVFPYHYMVDEYGNTTVLQYRERMTKRNGPYRWIGRLHESLLPLSQMAKALKTKDVEWVHHATAEHIEQAKERNKNILEEALEEEIAKDAVDPRTLFNLGNAYFTVGAYPKAIACYVKYIPMSGWRAERYLARTRCAMALTALGQYEQAIEASLTAIKEVPEYPDAYVNIGKAYYALKDYEKSLFWLQEAAKKPFPEGLPVVAPMEYLADTSWLIGHSLVQLYKFKEAKPYFQKFLSYFPNHKECKSVLQSIDEAIDESETVLALAKTAKIFNTDKFWELVPEKYLEYPEVLYEKNKIIRKPTSTGKDVAIYCGKCILPFDPTTESDEGIGGSEEAVINLARLLVKKGCNVTVFGRPKSIARSSFEGVNYVHFTKFNPRDQWDVFISWRQPSVLSMKINAKKKYLWLHDCAPEDSLTPEVLHNVTKIMVLSKFHRSLYPRVPEDKFMYTGNGINPDHFTGDLTIKNPFSCIYTSAPDRGLLTLLKMWPKIKQSVPEAELHWYYGWQVFDLLHKDNDGMKAFKQQILDALDQPGVFDHGRVNHEQIAKAYESSQLWLYPTEFTEIYCITADKAQAGNALPVTTTVGALDERVQYGTKFTTHDIYTNQEAQDKFITTVVSLLKNPNMVELERKGMRDYALNNCSWQRIADQWVKEFFMPKFKVLGGSWGEGHQVGDIIELDTEASTKRIEDGEIELVDDSFPITSNQKTLPTPELEAPVAAPEVAPEAPTQTDAPVESAASEEVAAPTV